MHSWSVQTIDITYLFLIPLLCILYSALPTNPPNSSSYTAFSGLLLPKFALLK